MKQLVMTAFLLARVNIVHAAGVGTLETAFNNFGDIFFNYIAPILAICLTGYGLIQVIGSNGTTGYRNFCGALIVSAILANLQDIFTYFFGWTFDF